MALTATQIRNAALDSNAVEEVLGVVMAFAARAVLLESGATANHAARAAYARTVLANPPQAAQAAKWTILTEPNLATVSPVALRTAVDASWDILAGA